MGLGATLNRPRCLIEGQRGPLPQGKGDTASIGRRCSATRVSLAGVLSSNMTAGCSKVVRWQATKSTGLRSLRRYAGATGTIAALALAALAVPGTGLTEPVAAAATAVEPGTSTAVREVKVPAADLETVGIPGGLSGPVLLRNQPALTAQGKVEVAYVGGGWCPFCALGNWPLQVALSQFGTFTQLGGPQSSSLTDVFPGLRSWSFTGARYVSKYFKLDAFESSQGSSQPYPPDLNALVNKYDRTPYTTTAGGIPFTDVGNHFLVIGSPSSPAPLMHLSQAQVAADLRHPESAVARTVDGAANYLVAAMCLSPGASSAPICASNFAERLDAKWAPNFPTTTTTSTTTTTVPSTTTTVPTTTSSSTTTTTSSTSTSTTTTTYP